MRAEAIGGHIEIFEVPTNGAPGQKAVLSQLTDKFGKPLAVTEQPVINAFGARVTGPNAPWLIGDRTVVMEGVGGRFDRGDIVAYSKKWSEAEAANKKPEPRL